MRTGFFALGEGDRPQLTQHLLRLSDHDRRLRFFHPADDAELSRLARSLPMHCLRGFFLLGQLVACAMVLPDAPRTVEFAVTVDQAHRGNGIASQLLSYGIDTTDDQVDRLVIHHLLENAPMARVHRKIPSNRRIEAGEVDVVIDLRALRQEREKAFGLLCGAEV